MGTHPDSTLLPCPVRDRGPADAEQLTELHLCQAKAAPKRALPARARDTTGPRSHLPSRPQRDAYSEPSTGSLSDAQVLPANVVIYWHNVCTYALLTCMTIRRRYVFYIDPDLDAGLKAVKARDGISESEQIRRAIRAWLEEKQPMRKSPPPPPRARGRHQ